jgi:hypothetical protein
MPDEATIPKGLLERIRVALSLPDEKLKALNEWAKKNFASLIGSEFTDTSIYDQLDIPRTGALGHYFVRV